MQPSPEFGDLLLEVPSNATFNEDELFNLPSIVDYVDRMPRDDEEILLEVFNLPEGAAFFLGSQEVTTVSGDGTLLIPVADLSELFLSPPQDFSGRFEFQVRAILQENGQTVVESVPPANVVVDVLPVAEALSPTRVSALEDQEEVIPLGAEIADRFTIRDDGTGDGNNNETESLVEFKITIPEDTLQFNHTVEGFFASLLGEGTQDGNGTAEITFSVTPGGTREYTIRSTLIPNGANSTDEELLSLSQEDRVTVTEDILATLAMFQISVGPEQTDLNGELEVTATIADVNTLIPPSGAVNINERTWRPLRVQAIADAPFVSVVDPAGVIVEEDGVVIPLNITVGASVDNGELDNSEVLSVRITVPIQPIIFPVPDETPIGEILYIGNLDLEAIGVTISEDGEGVWLIEADGDTPEEREDLLNLILTSGDLVFDPRDGWAGILTGAEGLQVDVITTEQATGNEVFLKNANTTAFIGLEVIPVADEPTVEVKGNAIGKEDVCFSNAAKGSRVW